jgi:hypothetical protein
MILIEADAALALLLPHRNPLLYSQIEAFKDHAESRDNRICVDVSAPALQRALCYYSHIFSRMEVTGDGRTVGAITWANPESAIHLGRMRTAEFFAKFPPADRRLLERFARESV